MKIFQKIMMTVAMMATLGLVASTPVMAEGESSPTSTSSSFLGLRPWYDGLLKAGSTDMKDVKEDCSGASEGCVELGNFVTLVAFNILMDATVIAGYLALSYIIYGGYKYMFSYGDPSKVATGKKTLTAAFIGLAIVMLSSVIFGTIKSVLIKNGADSGTVDVNGQSIELVKVNANLLLVETIQWAIGVAGVVAAIFIVYGGVSYVTATGDAGKLAKAKNAIIYSLIGLAIVVLSQVILGFVRNGINEARPTSMVETVMIGKGGQ